MDEQKNFMKKFKLNVLDFYFKYPFRSDLLLLCICFIVFYLFRSYIKEPEDFTKIDGLISNITSSIVSLTGFILASLTIIVTVKSNIKIRNLVHAENSMELLLSSGNYKSIILVFRDAIIELVFALTVIYIFWMPVFSFSKFTYMLLIAFGVLIIVTSVLRTLSLLFKIIFMEFKS
jgi:hypothetical protein